MTTTPGQPPRARQAEWMLASSTWAQHILECDHCVVGTRCIVEPALLGAVCTAYAAIARPAISTTEVAE